MNLSEGRNMNILIIYAHPNHQSFNGAVLEQVQNNLGKQHTVKTIDLYAEHFDPVLFFDKEHRRRDLATDPYTKKYRDLITWANELIFIFPVWWGGMPAILKGFTDRVFVSGWAYKGKKIGMEGKLGGRRAWIIISHDTPRIAVPFMPDYGSVLKRQVLGNCGIKPCRITHLTPLKSSTLEQRQKMLAKVGKMAREV